MTAFTYWLLHVTVFVCLVCSVLAPPPPQDLNLSYEQQGEDLPPRAGEAPAARAAQHPGGGGGGGAGGAARPQPGQGLQQLQLGGGERVGERRRVG